MRRSGSRICSIVTKMTRVAGLPQTASERAFDLFLKSSISKPKQRWRCGLCYGTQSRIRWPRCSRCSVPSDGHAASQFAPAFRFMGGNIRRNRNFDGVEPGRKRVSSAKAVSRDSLMSPSLMQQFRHGSRMCRPAKCSIARAEA